jgi:hypothetical protein
MLTICGNGMNERHDGFLMLSVVGSRRVLMMGAVMEAGCCVRNFVEG